jgi:hypothetical protein
MPETVEFCQAQAAACAAEAEAAALENVRNRCLRAQHAWLELAQRLSVGQRRNKTLSTARHDA